MSKRATHCRSLHFPSNGEGTIDNNIVINKMKSEGNGYIAVNKFLLWPIPLTTNLIMVRPRAKKPGFFFDALVAFKSNFELTLLMTICTRILETIHNHFQLSPEPALHASSKWRHNWLARETSNFLPYENYKINLLYSKNVLDFKKVITSIITNNILMFVRKPSMFFSTTLSHFL